MKSGDNDAQFDPAEAKLSRHGGHHRSRHGSGHRSSRHFVHSQKRKRRKQAYLVAVFLLMIVAVSFILMVKSCRSDEIHTSAPQPLT